MSAQRGKDLPAEAWQRGGFVTRGGAAERSGWPSIPRPVDAHGFESAGAMAGNCWRASASTARR